MKDITFHSLTLKPRVSLITPDRADTRTTRVTLYSTGFMESPDSLLGPSSSLRSLVASLSTLVDTPRRSRLLACVAISGNSVVVARLSCVRETGDHSNELAS